MNLEQQKPQESLKGQGIQNSLLSTLLYGIESWVMHHHQLHLLEHFCQCCLCTILKVLDIDQHQGQTPQDTAALGWTCLRDVRPPPAKVPAVW